MDVEVRVDSETVYFGVVGFDLDRVHRNSATIELPGREFIEVGQDYPPVGVDLPANQLKVQSFNVRSFDPTISSGVLWYYVVSLRHDWRLKQLKARRSENTNLIFWLPDYEGVAVRDRLMFEYRVALHSGLSSFQINGQPIGWRLSHIPVLRWVNFVVLLLITIGTVLTLLFPALRWWRTWDLTKDNGALSFLILMVSLIAGSALWMYLAFSLSALLTALLAICVVPKSLVATFLRGIESPYAPKRFINWLSAVFD